MRLLSFCTSCAVGSASGRNCSSATLRVTHVDASSATVCACRLRRSAPSPSARRSKSPYAARTRSRVRARAWLCADSYARAPARTQRATLGWSLRGLAERHRGGPRASGGGRRRSLAPRAGRPDLRSGARAPHPPCTPRARPRATCAPCQGAACRSAMARAVLGTRARPSPKSSTPERRLRRRSR